MAAADFKSLKLRLVCKTMPAIPPDEGRLDVGMQDKAQAVHAGVKQKDGSMFFESWGECPPFLPEGGKCAVIEGDPQVANALFTLRSKLPDNYKIAPHFHPTDEHITVISGTFAMGLGKEYDEESLVPMSTGSFMVMPKGEPHFALTHGETIVQVHALGPMIFTYINPNDNPEKH